MSNHTSPSINPSASCDECGWSMRPTDSGHSACLYCRLPDLLDQARWVARRDTAPVLTTFVAEDRKTFVRITQPNPDGPCFAHLATREFSGATWGSPKILSPDGEDLR